jgi:hypothetical protein
MKLSPTLTSALVRKTAIARAFSTFALASLVGTSAFAADHDALLPHLRHHTVLASTITDNGDVNPYALVVAPVSAGTIHKDDVLVGNFNSSQNLQGTGTTIAAYTPGTKHVRQFAQVPQHLAGCPGGVGFSTAMTMLQSGWIIIGSTPSRDGTTRTGGDGCLVVLDPHGKVVTTWAGPNISDPWGNMAVVDNGSSAVLFISMAGFGLPGPDVKDPKTGNSVTKHNAKVLRLNLTIPDGKPPEIKQQTIIADGIPQQADLDNFLFGPTGITLGPDNTLYVSDGIGNRILKIADAVKRTTSAGVGETVTQGGLLKNPLALLTTPGGNLLVSNGLNGQVVEIDPTTGKQLFAQWIDVDQAQFPPGNGDLFGIAMKPDGKGFYFVEDDTNALAEDTQ